MNKLELAPGIICYKDVISHATTLNIQMESAMEIIDLKWEPAYVRSGNENIIDKSYRDTGSIYVPYNNNQITDYSTPTNSFFSSLSNLFLEKFTPVHDDYKDHYGTTTKFHESYAILKYGIGQNFVNHIDDFDNTRQISMVYYMNNDYSGGEIVFPRFDLTYKPGKDEMIMFPSTYVYNHSVLPVTSGVRYAIASWLK